MIKIFDIIKQFVELLNFHLILTRKWLAILLKKNRKLKNLSFDYYKNWHSDKCYLIIDFKFKNAIYFKVGETKSFDFSIPLILNLQNLKTNKIMVEVYGFLQKQIFIIELNKEIDFDTKSFKTKLENLSLIGIPRQKTNLKISKFLITFDKPKVMIQSISANSNNISMKSNKFKIQEYI